MTEKILSSQDEIQKAVHEIKNLLTLIQSSLSLIEQQHPEVESFRFWQDTHSDLDEIFRLTNIISGENKKRNREQTAAEVLEAVSSAAEMLAPLCMQRGIKFLYRQENAQELRELEGRFDLMQVKRAVLNLIKNAIEACDYGGDIELTMQLQTVGERIYLVIEVSDTGAPIGITKKERVFCENFSTKKDGSGKGLAVVKECATQHEGYVTIQTDDNKTVFCMYLLAA